MILRRQRHSACLSDGLLRSVVDDGVNHMPEIDRHLHGCAHCRQRLAAISEDASYVEGRLAVLLDNDVETNSTAARLKLRNRISESDPQVTQKPGDSFMSTMWKYRAARGAVAMLAVVLLTAAFVATPMRSLADDWLNRFEVEEFEAITLQPEAFSELGTDMLLRAFTADQDALMAAFEGMAEVETSFDQDAIESNVTKFDSVDDAREAYGSFQLPSDLPDGFNEAPQFMMSNDESVTVTVDTASVQTIIDELSLPIDSIPSAAQMPEMVFQMDIPSALVSHYGAGTDGHLAVIQMASPTLTTPEGLNMDALREDVLDLPGMPDEFVNQLRAIDDWHNTLVIPVPEGAETRDVTVDGEPGLLLEAGEFDGSSWGIDFMMDGDLSVVMWNEDGILYIVAGTVSGDEVLDAANSMR